MKKYIKSSKDNITKISVIVDIELPIKFQQIAAKTFDGKDLPQGELLPAEKDTLIDSQALADYHAFIESVEDLITDYYELCVYYKNDSPNNSFYFGCIAKNSDGTPVIDFEASIRVSNHDAVRSAQSRRNKKLQREALQKEIGTAKLKPVRKNIIVNKDEFDNYDDAYDAVDKIIEDVCNKLKREQK